MSERQTTKGLRVNTYHCASHGDGAALRQRLARCQRCGWDGGATALTVVGEGRNVARGYNGRSASARRRDVKPNGSHAITGTTVGEYTRRVSRPAEAQAMARMGFADRRAQKDAAMMEAMGGYA